MRAPLLLIVVGVVMLMLSRFASASEVRFAVVGIVPPKEEFSILPESPTSADVIEFFDPFDKQVYTNQCIAATVLGTPQIAVNESERRIAITFVPFIDDCSDLALLVSGLEGNVGPLSAGQWTYQTPLASHSFTVVPEPRVLWIAVPLAVALGGRRGKARSEGRRIMR